MRSGSGPNRFEISPQAGPIDGRLPIQELRWGSASLRRLQSGTDPVGRGSRVAGLGHNERHNVGQEPIRPGLELFSGRELTGLQETKVQLSYLMCTPEMARAMISRWISEVPSKMV